MATTTTASTTTGEDELSIQSALWRKRQSINSEIAAFTHQKEIEYRELEKLLRTKEAPENLPNPSPREHAQFAGLFAPTFLPLLDERYRIPPERAATPAAASGVKTEEPKEETKEAEAAKDVKDSTKDADTKAVKPVRPSAPRSHPSALRLRRQKSLKRVTFQFDDNERVPSRSSPPTDSSSGSNQSELAGERFAELVVPGTEGQSRDASPPAIPPPPPADSNIPPPPASPFSFADPPDMSSPNGYEDSDGEEGLFDLDETIPPPTHHEPPHRDPISPLLPPARENNHPVALPNASYTNSYKASHTRPAPTPFPKSTPISFAKQPPSSFSGHPRSSLSEGFFHTPLHTSTVPASLPTQNHNFPRLQQNSLRQRSISKYIPSPPSEPVVGSPAPTPVETPHQHQVVGSLPVAISSPAPAAPKPPPVGTAPATMLPSIQSPYRTKFAQQVAEEALMEGGGEGYVADNVDVDPGSVPMEDVGGFSFSRKLEMEMDEGGRRRRGRT